jgi:hypothetical protein
VLWIDEAGASSLRAGIKWKRREIFNRKGRKGRKEQSLQGGFRSGSFPKDSTGAEGSELRRDLCSESMKQGRHRYGGNLEPSSSLSGNFKPPAPLKGPKGARKTKRQEIRAEFFVFIIHYFFAFELFAVKFSFHLHLRPFVKSTGGIFFEHPPAFDRRSPST